MTHAQAKDVLKALKTLVAQCEAAAPAIRSIVASSPMKYGGPRIDLEAARAAIAEAERG